MENATCLLGVSIVPPHYKPCLHFFFMEHIDGIDVKSLLSRFVMQMTGEELCVLARYILAESLSGEEVSRKTLKYAYGIRELSIAIGCCESRIYALKRLGVFDDAVVSRIGKKIVFDIEKARASACEYLTISGREK